MQVLTEGEIGAAIVRNVAGARVGDSIDIAMFYLSERDVIQALIAAAKRGVAVRVMLDPNKDAFGRTKNGIPNRSVATELAAASDGAIKVRWFRTHGEQFHSKLVADAHAPRNSGSRWDRPISRGATSENFNLEANIAASVPLNAEIATQISTWFDSLWTNHGPPELEYTAEFGAYADPSQGTLLAVSADGSHRAIDFLNPLRRPAVGLRPRSRSRPSSRPSPWPSPLRMPRPPR